MFTITKKRCNQPGQCLLVVLKDGKEDKGGNAYVQQQVPEDFADYLIGLQRDRLELLEDAAVIVEQGVNPRNAARQIRDLLVTGGVIEEKDKG